MQYVQCLRNQKVCTHAYCRQQAMLSEVLTCLTLKQKREANKLGKHEKHAPHDWWATSKGGGHQLYDGWQPSNLDEQWDKTEGYVKLWYCPGIDEETLGW